MTLFVGVEQLPPPAVGDELVMTVALFESECVPVVSVVEVAVRFHP